MDTDGVGQVHAAPEGFDEAFPALYRRARGLAQRILGEPTAAEDAAAEAMARAFVHWKRVGPLPYRDGWVLRVTANVAIDAARRRARAVPPVVDEPVEPIEELVVLRSALVEALSQLPRRQRDVLVLTYLVGFTPSEAAETMGISPSSVAQHARRGLGRLRQSFSTPPNLTIEPGSSGVPI